MRQSASALRHITIKRTTYFILKPLAREPYRPDMSRFFLENQIVGVG